MSTSQQVDPLIGQLVDDRYRVRSRIARGGMATVYVATDLRLERRIALKVMHAHLSDDSVFQSRFIQEARSAARLADPHVVNVFDQGQDGELAYLVMEYLPGITLRDLLKEQKRLTITQTITVMDAVLSGLAAAHTGGLIHRDVKPENVLLAEDGRIKIGDFGLARATSANTATGAQLLGTIAYLAPELVTRGMADARSDIYALGIMLYEMLTGVQPFRGEQPMQIAYQHATDSVPRPSVRNPGVPEQIDELVLWATEKDPDERPGDAGEMLDRLREIERELGIAPMASRGPSIVVPARAQRGPRAQRSDQGDAVLAHRAGHRRDHGRSDAVDGSAARRQLRQTAPRHGAALPARLLRWSPSCWCCPSSPGAADGTGALGPVPASRSPMCRTARSPKPRRRCRNSIWSPRSTGCTASPRNRAPSSEPTPEPGASVDRETVVAVNVSLGAAEVDIPALPGTALGEATDQLDELGIEVESVRKYYLDATPGNVTNVRIRPRGAGDDDELVKCIDGCTVHDGDAAVLSVSLGAVPDVAGRSVQDAENALEDVGLTVADDVKEQYSDTISADQVIGTVEKDGVFAEGDTIQLITSLGPRTRPRPGCRGHDARRGRCRSARRRLLRDDEHRGRTVAVRRWHLVGRLQS